MSKRLTTATAKGANMSTASEHEGVRESIEQKFSGIKVYYREEEPGCEVFNTNSFDVFLTDISELSG